MRAIALALSLLAPTVPSANAPGLDRYATGQVWAYHTRPGDEGSLLKIQAIERDPGAIRGSLIYHISIIGVHFRDREVAPALPHVPVSRAALDASVTEQAQSAEPFPDADPGIEEWRRARGGVFTMDVAQIIGSIDASMKAM